MIQHTHVHNPQKRQPGLTGVFESTSFCSFNCCSIESFWISAICWASVSCSRNCTVAAVAERRWKGWYLTPLTPPQHHWRLWRCIIIYQSWLNLYIVSYHRVHQDAFRPYPSSHNSVFPVTRMIFSPRERQHWLLQSQIAAPSQPWVPWARSLKSQLKSHDFTPSSKALPQRFLQPDSWSRRKLPSSGHLGISSERWPLALAAPQALGLIVQQHGGCHVPGP